MIKLTKAASGVRTSDVSNATIRNILTEISIKLYGRFTARDLEFALDFFEWKCPYTGVDLRSMIDTGSGYATDHIVPQNKEYCGLNIKGNLVIASVKANRAKNNRSAESFLLDDSLKIWIDTPKTIRENRLARIREFQENCNYNPDEVKNALNPLLERIYKEVQKEQKDRIEEIINAIQDNNN